MSFTNAATVAKDAFIVKVREQLNLNMNGQELSYEGLKIRLKTANRVAKIINKDMRNIIDEMICASSPEKTGKLMSVMYLKMDEMINGCSNVHRNTYLTSEKEIIKIRKYAIKLQKNSRKALDILIELIQKVDKFLVPSYDLIVAKHNNIQSEYWLRTRTPINYIEEDSNFDDPSDEDYKPYEHVSKTVIKNTASRPKRNIPVVDYTGMDTIEPESEYDNITDIWYDNSIHYDSDYEFQEDDDEDDELDSCVDASNDDDSEYDPSEDAEDEDDHVLDFCDDDYAEESEDDDSDYDYEDEDEYSTEDSEFMNEYNNDPEYLLDEDEEDDEEEFDFDEHDDDSEYTPSEADEDDEEFDFDEEDDNDSDYTPSEYDEDDEEFVFDEEDEDDDDDDDDDDENDEEDKQFVSDYLNDPDYDPDEDEDEEDEYEYDFSYLNKKVDDDGNIVLKAGIADDNDEEDPEYDLTEDQDDEDEDDTNYNNNKNILNICKRRFENGNVVYRWVKMTKEEAEKKYDEDYVFEDN